jgi:hypothetical protein
VSSTRSILDQQKDDEAAAIQQKMQGKLHQAAAKKERHRLQFSLKVQAKFAKISSQKDQAEQSLQQMGEMFAERMAAATTRKSMLDSESQEKVEGHGSKRQELAVSFQKSKDANVSTKKLELDGNLASAVERKQALMNAKTAKVTEYLTRAYERGQEAMKRKEEMSLNGHEVEDPMMGMSLSSITEEQATEEQVFDPFDPKHNDGDDDGDEDGGFDGAMEDLALLWLDDENSVASFSTTGTNSSKSKVQARGDVERKRVLGSPTKDEAGRKA